METHCVTQKKKFVVFDADIMFFFSLYFFSLQGSFAVLPGECDATL